MCRRYRAAIVRTVLGRRVVGRRVAARTVIAWMLTAAMVLSPALVYAQPPQAASAGQAKLDLGWVTPETAGVAIDHPHRVLSAPQMGSLPIEVLSAAGLKELGIRPG